MNIKQMFLSIGVNRPGERLNPTGIVVHETATPGATAENERAFFASANRDASAHYFVDDMEIVQCIPENEVAWHAGPTANHRYLSVEMCHFDDPVRFDKTWKNTVALVADICHRYGWGPQNVFSHAWVSQTFHETDHTDPLGYFQAHGKSWGDFLIDVHLAIQGGKPKMNQSDAQKIIGLLGQIWWILPDDDKRGKDEIHRLANVVRKAAGMPEQEG